MFRINMLRAVKNTSTIDTEYKHTVLCGIPTTFDVEDSIFSLLFQNGDSYCLSNAFACRADSFSGITLHHQLMGSVHGRCAILMTDLSQAVWATKASEELQSKPAEYGQLDNVLAMSALCQIVVMVTACLRDPELAIQITVE